MTLNERNDGGMILEFRAVLKAILDYLQHGETKRAIAYIESILNDK